MAKGSMIVAAAVCFALAGCGQPPAPTVQTAGANKITYGLNGKNYSTFEEMLAAFDGQERAQINALTPAPTPHPGRALIVIPDRDRLRPLVRSDLQRAANGPSPQAMAAYIERVLEDDITTQQHSLQFVVQAIERSRVFETVEVSERNDAVRPEIGDHQYLVWYQVRSTGLDLSGPWIGGWMVLRREASTPAVFAYDPGSPPTRRLASLVDSLNAALKSQGTASAK